MITKCSIAQKLALVGIKVHIANGKTPGILTQILTGALVGTVFVPQANQSKLKRWVANSESYAKGFVYINAGARDRLLHTRKATSLLPVGIARIEGNFQKGDIIKIATEDGEVLGLGMAQYSAALAQTYAGEKNKKPLVHYDYLFLFDPADTQEGNEKF
jgi:glutamate 5-kinase